MEEYSKSGWKERRDLLEKLCLKEIKTKNDFFKMVRYLKEAIQTDKNFFNVTIAVKLLQVLIKKAEKRFIPCGSAFIPLLFQMFKVKNRELQNALIDTIGKLLHLRSLVINAALVENIKEASKNKNPEVKYSVLCLVKCIFRDTVLKHLLYLQVIPHLQNLLEDKNERVRIIAAEALAYAVKAYGIKVIPFLQRDNMKIKKYPSKEYSVFKDFHSANQTGSFYFLAF